jgi:hypothetical protein
LRSWRRDADGNGLQHGNDPGDWLGHADQHPAPLADRQAACYCSRRSCRLVRFVDGFPRPQFRLSTLLWITLAVACWFGGMRFERWFAHRNTKATVFLSPEWLSLSPRGHPIYAMIPRPQFRMHSLFILTAIAGGRRTRAVLPGRFRRGRRVVEWRPCAAPAFSSGFRRCSGSHWPWPAFSVEWRFSVD